MKINPSETTEPSPVSACRDSRQATDDGKEEVEEEEEK